VSAPSKLNKGRRKRKKQRGLPK